MLSMISLFFGSLSFWDWFVFWCAVTVLLIVQACIPCLRRCFSIYVSKLFFFSGISCLVMCLGSYADAVDQDIGGSFNLGHSFVAFLLWCVLLVMVFVLVTLWHYARSDFKRLRVHQSFYQGRFSCKGSAKPQQGAGAGRASGSGRKGRRVLGCDSSE